MDKAEIQNIINNKIEFAEKKYGKDVKFLLIETLSLEKMLKPDAKAQTRLIPVTQWNKYHPYPSVSGMRMKVFYEEINGFKECGVIQRDGKRVLINENAYFHWLKEKGKQESA